ncbi:MAG: hypothetical protein QOJ34_854, partial [Pseudonocardiales bacterium]|nr:hypothetical protein [Pseudonocardiales bacterium]
MLTGGSDGCGTARGMLIAVQ